MSFFACAGPTPEELAEMERLETLERLRREQIEKETKEREEAEEALLRQKRHEEWVKLIPLTISRMTFEFNREVIVQVN